jgi:hypothetical protein
MTNLTYNSFSICLFQFSTCLEQTRAHHQENQLCRYNICYVSLCVGDGLVCRSGRNFPTCILDRASRYNSCKWPILTQNFFPYMLISVLYMFRATSSSSSGESIVSIQHLLCVTLCRWPSSVQVGNDLHRVTHTGRCIDTIDSPDDGHGFARNM